MSLKVWIVFSQSELEKNISKISPEDIIIADIDPSKFKQVNIKQISNVSVNDEVIVEVKNYFENISEKYGKEIIGFSNNFFQSTIVLLIQYKNVLDNIVKENKDIDIYFCNDIYLASNGPNYYMAEAESQGIRFYNREAALFKTLLKYCKDNNFSVKFISKKISKQKILNVFRLFSVYLIKFFFDMRSSSFFTTSLINKDETDFDFISRTYSQSQFLKKNLIDNGFSNHIYVFENFNNKNHFEDVEKIFSNLNNVSFSFFKNSYYSVVTMYIKQIKFFNVFKREVIHCENMEIDLTQAINEIIVMYPHILLYKKQLEQLVFSREIPKNKILFSTEQKSPHAFIDALVAKKFNLKSVQLMQCDQNDNNLPLPITGDLFVPISKEKYNSFKKNWKNNVNKIYYPGNIIRSLSHNNVKPYKICYFASFIGGSDIHNIKVVKHLSKLAKKNKFKFLIKLHPRDNGKWTKNIQNNYCKVFYHNDIEQIELFKQFDIAITNFSAVVISMLEYKIKYILLNIDNINYKDKGVFYVDEKYEPIVSELNKIDYWIYNEHELEKEFNLFFNRYYKDVDICTSEIYFKRILKRIHT